MKYVLIVLMCLMFQVNTTLADITLTWAPNTESDLAGYKVYRGVGSCVTAMSGATTTLLTTLGKTTTYVDSAIPNTALGTFYELTAYDLTGNESGKSSRVCKDAIVVVLPPPPSGLNVVLNVFLWNAEITATSYLLRVHEEGTPYDPCELMTFCGEVFMTSKTLALVPGKRYDWWIHSKNVNGYGSSNGSSFVYLPIVNVPSNVQVR